VYDIRLFNIPGSTCLLIFSLPASLFKFIIITVVKGVDCKLYERHAWDRRSRFSGERSCLRSHYISKLLERKLIVKREGLRRRKTAY